MDGREDNAGIDAQDTSHTIVNALRSLDTNLNATNAKISKLQTKMDAVYELLKRPEPSRIPQPQVQMNVSNDGSDRPTEAMSKGKKVPLSPKTMMIEMMEEDREEQQRALDQIEDLYEETRPW